METKINMNKNSHIAFSAVCFRSTQKEKLNYTIDAQHLRSDTKKDKSIKMNFSCKSLLKVFVESLQKNKRGF